MPRSHGVLKVEVWEAASDFRRLPLDVQWAYAMLISQPQINNLGVLPYLPEKWWRFAKGLTPDRLEQLLGELEQHRYTITDVDTGELLVRTFIKHDAVWKQPKLVTNARRLIREVESQPIRSYLVQRHPWLIDETWPTGRIASHETTQETPIDTPSETPIDTPIANGGETPPETPNERGITSRARAQDGLPQPLPQPQPQGPKQPAAAAEPRATHDDEPAAAATRLRLEHLGLTTDIPDHDLPRANAWLDLANREADTNPAGYVRRGLDSGAWPTPRAGSYSEKTRANGEVDWESKARELFERTADREQVADWLAGLTRVPVPERERILVAVAGPERMSTGDEEPDFGDEP